MNRLVGFDSLPKVVCWQRCEICIAPSPRAPFDALREQQQLVQHRLALLHHASTRRSQMEGGSAIRVLKSKRPRRRGGGTPSATFDGCERVVNDEAGAASGGHVVRGAMTWHRDGGGMLHRVTHLAIQLVDQGGPATSTRRARGCVSVRARRRACERCSVHARGEDGEPRVR